MHFVLERLKNGDRGLLNQFREADNEWAEILQDVSTDTVKQLADKLSVAQIAFEQIFGDLTEGKEAMPWTGFAHLYEPPRDPWRLVGLS